MLYNHITYTFTQGTSVTSQELEFRFRIPVGTLGKIVHYTDYLPILIFHGDHEEGFKGQLIEYFPSFELLSEDVLEKQNRCGPFSPYYPVPILHDKPRQQTLALLDADPF